MKTSMRLFAGSVLLAIAVYLAWSWSSGNTARRDLEKSGDLAPSSVAGKESGTDLASESDPLLEEDLSRQAIDCQLIEGRDNQQDRLAAVVTSDRTTSLVTVVDGDGTLLSRDIHFRPNSVNVVRRSDGSILLGIGDTRKNSKEFRDPGSAEPIVVAHNNEVLFESDKAFEFGLAGDGSSFYAVEPTAAGTSRMIVRNIDAGTENHFDLGSMWAANNDELAYHASYLPTNEAVMVAPSDPATPGERYFFSSSSDRVTTITPPSSPNHVATTFLSPDSAVLVRRIGDNRYLVSRAQLAPEASASDEKGWNRELALDQFYGRVSLSDDGNWIVLHAWRTVVLSTATGSTVFQWPVAGDRDEEERRISGSLPADTIDDGDLGAVTGVSIRNGRLLLHRTMGLDAFSDCHNQADPNECMANARREVREYLDVFEMSDIDVDSGPDFRMELSDQLGCSENVPSVGTLDTVDGRVVYQQRGFTGNEVRE